LQAKATDRKLRSLLQAVIKAVIKNAQEEIRTRLAFRAKKYSMAAWM